METDWNAGNVGQYFWKSNANDQHYYFLERSVWLMRLIRAIEVEDTEILKAFKKKVFKDEVDISEGAQWDRKFTKPLEALKTVLEGKEKSKALEKLIEWFQKSANDSDEFLWVVSEKLSPMKDGGSYIRISQRRTDSENKIRVNKNLPPAQQQINSLADTEGTKENINNSSAAEKQIITPVGLEGTKENINNSSAAEKQIITPVGLEGTKENINNSSAAEQQIDSSVNTEGTKENNYNNSLKQPNSQEVGFKSVDGYKKESSALKPLQLDPGSKIKTDSGAWGWISVIKCSSAESNSWFVPDAIDMPGFCKIMPRAIVRRLEISASARYIAIFSPSKSSYEKRLKSLFRFFKKFRIYKNQIEERCNYYREEKMREELELLRRYNGSRYSELRMDALKTSLLGSSIWDTFDEKLGLSKAMETFESNYRLALEVPWRGNQKNGAA